MAALRAAFAVLALLIAAPAALAQEGRWLRAETPQFIVYSDGSERQVREAVEDLESFAAFLHLITQAPPQTGRQPRLEVYLFRSASMMAQVWPGAQRYTFGFYAPSAEAVAIFATLRGAYGVEARHTLYHEYAHHFMYQYFPTAYPAWYSEGFAEYVATTDITPARVDYGEFAEARVSWLLSQPWLPMSRILTASPHELSADESAMFYAQAWLLVHYIFYTPEARAAFNAYARALQSGADRIAAFSEAFGQTPEQVQARLRTYLRRLHYTRMTGWSGPAHAPLVFTRMPASADDLLPLSARLRIGVTHGAEAEQVASLVRAAAAPYPNDAFAQATLARAELEVGQFDRAREILTPVVAANPDSLDANYLMGATYLLEGWLHPDRDVSALNLRARRYLTRASTVDRAHAPTLYRYAQAAWTDPGQSENAFDVLLEARALAPQVPEIAIGAAVELMRRGRHPEAARLLRPIAFNPHATAESAAPLRELLARAERGEAPDQEMAGGPQAQEAGP